MKVYYIKCPKCGDKIYSRARHDYRACGCNSVFVDGGFDYMRCGALPHLKLEQGCIDLDVTEEELYDDWNKNINKYGIIKED